MAKMSEKLLQAKMEGSEPTPGVIEDSNSAEFSRVLYWYTRNYEEAMLEKLASKMKLKIPTRLLIPNRTLLVIEHMISVGWKLPADVIERHAYRMKTIRQKLARQPKAADTETETKRRSPYDIQLDNVMLQLDDELDKRMRDEKHKHSMYDFFQANRILPQVAQKVKEKVEQHIADYALEGYENIPRPKMKAQIEFMKSIVSDVSSYVSGKKASVVRKPRKKRAVPTEKLVSKVKYQQADKDLKIVSVPPEGIIGAKSAWLYNSKYRRLIVLNAAEGATLSISGTTVVGFNEAASSSKSLRKPDAQLPELINAGKPVLRKFMDGIKTSAYPASGRINDQTLIVRVVK